MNTNRLVRIEKRLAEQRLNGLLPVKIRKSIALILLLTFGISQSASAAELNEISLSSPQMLKEINADNVSLPQDTASQKILPLSSTDFLQDTLTLKPIHTKNEKKAALLVEETAQHHYEYDRYEFEDALEQLRPEYASAVIVKDLKEEDLLKLLDLGFETAVLVLHGEIVLVTSGSEDEIGVLPAVKDLIGKAGFISHTHPGIHSAEGPSGQDINAAVEAPDEEYVVTHQGVYVYNREGILNDGIPLSFAWYLEKLLNQKELDSAEIALSSARNDGQVQARAYLNTFIAEQDRYNQASEEERITFRRGGTLSPAAGLTAANVTALPGAPYAYKNLTSSANTWINYSSVTGLYSLNYDTAAAGAFSGMGITFDNVNTSAMETRDLSALTELVFGLKGPSTSAKLEIVDVNGIKDTFTFTGISNTSEAFWKVPVSAIAGTLNKQKIHYIQFIVDQTSTTPAARTGVLSIRANGTNINPPAAPVVTTPPAFSKQTSVVLSGTKPAYTSLFINGLKVVPYDASTTWTATVSLSQEAANSFTLYTSTAISKNSINTVLSIYRDTVIPTGGINVNSGALYAAAQAVTLNLTGSDSGSGINTMSFSTNNTSWTTPEIYNASRSFTLPAGDGNKTVYVKYYDKAGNVSAVYSKSITLDTLVPSGTIKVNNGVSFINQAAVTLNLSASDAGSGLDKMSFSTDNLTYTAAETYAAAKAWTFPTGDGNKIVYVKFLDKSGKWSAPASATVQLDMVKPTGSININSGSLYTAAKAVTLNLSGVDAGSGLDKMNFSTDNVTWSAVEAYAASKSFTLPAGDGNKTVYVKFYDKAGNISTVYSKSIVLDTVAPSGTFSVNGGALFTNTRSITAALSASDSGSGIDQVRFSVDGGTTWAVWENYAASKALTLPAGDGNKALQYQVRDKAGNVKTLTASIGLDTTALVGSIKINADAASTNAGQVTLSLTASDSFSGIGQMRFTTDTVNWIWTAWENYQSTKTLTLPAGDGLKQVFWQIYDKAWNLTSGSDSILLDTAAPTGSFTINNGAAATNNTAVNLQISVTDTGSTLDKMSFAINSTDPAAFSAWEPFNTTKVLTLPNYQGANYINIKIRDKAGNETFLWKSIIVDTVAPAASLVINGNAAQTILRDVTLTLTAADSNSGLAQMRFTTDTVNWIWTPWEDFKTTKTLTLPAGAGTKQVYFQIYDKAGNFTSASDSILLASAPPSIQNISIEEGAVVEIPYLAISYDLFTDGILTPKFKEVNLQAGLNTIEIKEINTLGQEVLAQRHLYYVPEALDPVLQTLHDRLIQENAKYFQEGQGIDAVTGFPVDFMGPTAPTGAQWTQPTAIGFYLQFLSEVMTRRIQVSFLTPTQALAQADKVLTSLNQAQTQWGWKGLIPWLKLKPALGPDSSKVALIDNANLTQSLVAFLGALSRANLDKTLAKNLSAKAETFIANQQEGYRSFVDAPSGVFRATYDKTTAVFDGYTDRFGSEVRSSIPFLIQFFGISDSVWNNLIRSTSRYVTEEGRVVETFSTFDGGGFQYFWPLLNSPEESLPQISVMLENALLIQQDFMKRNHLPGFASASSLPEGGYSGNVGIGNLKETPQAVDETLGSVYSLAAAYRVDPAFVLTKLREIEAAFPNLKGPLGFYDSARSNTAVSKNYYAIDQGSLILGLAGGGGDDFKYWLQKKGLWQAYEGYYSQLNFGITQAVQTLPEPDMTFDEIYENAADSGNIYNSLYDWDQLLGNGMSISKKADGTFLYTPVTPAGWVGGSVTPPVDLDQYAFVNVQIRSTFATGGQVDFEAKNDNTLVLKKTLTLNNDEWQQFQIFFPKTAPDVNFIDFAKATKGFEVRQITFNNSPLFMGTFPPLVEMKSSMVTNKQNYLLQYQINGIPYEETVTLANGNNPLVRTFRDIFGREYKHSFQVTYDGAGPVVLFLSSLEASSSSYILAYSVDGVRKEESVMLQEGENLLVRSAVNAAGNTTTKTFKIILDSKPPEIQTFRVNQGSAVTKSANVILDILAFDLGSSITRMSFSNDGVNFTAPETFQAAKNWTLNGGKGQKTVWIKLEDAKGFWSQAVSVGIFYEKALTIDNYGEPSLVQTYWESDDTQVYQRSYIVNNTDFDAGAAMAVDFTKKPNLLYSYMGLLLKPGDYSQYSTLHLKIKKSSTPPMVLMAKLEFEGTTQTYETQVGFPQGASANWEDAVFDFSSVPAVLMAKLQKILLFADPGNGTSQGRYIIDSIAMDERLATKQMDDFEGNGFPIQTYWDWDGTAIYQRSVTEEKSYDGTHSMKVNYQKKAGFPYSFFAMTPKQNGIDNNFSNYGSLRFQMNKNSNAPMVLMMKLEFNDTAETFEKQIYFPQGSNQWQEVVFDFSSVGPSLLSRIKNVMFFVDPANETNQGSFYMDRIRLAEKPLVQVLDDYEGNSGLIQTYWDGDGAGVVYTRTVDATQGVDGTHSMRIQYHKTPQYPTPYFGIQLKQDGLSNDLSKYNVLKVYVKKESLPAMKLMMKLELDGTQINFEAWKEIPQGATGWSELVYDFSSLSSADLKKVRSILFFADPVFYTVAQDTQGVFLMDSLRLAYDADLPAAQFDPVKPPQLGWVGSSVASDVDNEYRAGSLVRINAWELNAAGDLLDGSVRITSASTGYDSGEQKLIFLHDGQFWPFHWDTTGLQPADDYKIIVSMKDKSGNVATFGTAAVPALTVRLTQGIPAGGSLIQVQDFSTPFMSGASFSASRSYEPFDAAIYDHQLGLGWHSSFDVFAQDFPDGTVSINLGTAGYQFFFRNADGTYRSMAPDNYSTLTKLTTGFQLRLKDGTIYEIDSAPFIDKNTKTSVTWFVTRIIDRNQNETRFFYDENRNPNRVQLPSGEEILLSYSFRNRDQFNTNKYHLDQITDPTGRIWKFEHDVKGNLLSETNPFNQKTLYMYDEKSRLIKITYPDGSTQAYAYDAQSRVISIKRNDVVQSEYLYGDRNDSSFKIKDALGRITTFILSLQGSVTEIIDAAGARTQYFYDAKKNLTKQIDAVGKITTFNYDAKGNMIDTTDPLLKVTRYSYDPVFNQVTSRTDALNNVTFFNYDARGNLIKLTDPALNFSQFTYDLKGNLIQSKDALGNATTYMYDSHGLMLSETNALGKKTLYTYDSRGNLIKTTDALGRIYQIDYDLLDRTVSTTDALNRKTAFVYDAMGRIIKRTDALNGSTLYEYDAMGRLTGETDELSAKTSLTYDAKGNILTSKDALGNVSTFTYDALDHMTQVKDALGRITSFAYDKMGRKISETNADLKTVLLEYDARGQLTKTTFPNTAVQTNTYDALGRLSTETDALGGVTTYTYDSRGNLVSQKDALNAVTVYEYDKRNQLLSVKDPLNNKTSNQYDVLGNLTKTVYPDNTASIFQYDDVSQLILSKDPLSRNTAYAYDAVGNLTFVTDPAGNKTETQYDALNRKIKDTDVLGQMTSYTYDAASRLTKITDAKSNATTMKYDVLGRLNETTYPDFSTETLKYDAVGNGVESTDRMARKTFYAYDKLNRLMSKTFADNSKEAYTYDMLGNTLTETNAAGTVSNEYDLLGRLTKTTDTFGNILTYTYDLTGNLKKTTVAIGAKTLSRDYTYDTAGRLTQITDEKARKTTYAYDSRSRVTSKVMANGTRADYVYNAASELTSITHKNPAGTAFRTLTYSYDSRGLITSKGDTAEGTSTFAYDKIGQLVSVMHPILGLTVFALDALGNRTQTKEDAAAVTENYAANAMNEYTTAGTSAFTYDANGNMTKRTDSATGQITQYEYNFEDMLTRVVLPNGTNVTFTYDALGRRISKTVGSVTTRFVWDGNELLAEFDGSGNVLRSYTHGLEVDEVLYQEDYLANETLYFHQDHLMSTLALTTSMGALKESYTYDSYGNTLTKPAVSSTRLLYAGRELDTETKLYYNRARYYDSDLGRFISSDPKGYAAGMNLFAYVKNNPLTFRDPQGLDTYWGGCGGGGGGGFFGAAASFISSAASAVSSVVSSAYSGLSSAISGAYSGISSVVSSVANAVSSAASHVGQAVSSAASSVGNAVSSAVSAVGTAIGTALNVALYPIQQIGQGIYDWAAGEGQSLDSNNGNSLSPKDIMIKFSGRLFTNGINTSKNQALSQAKQTKSALFYNPTHGVLADLVESFLQKITGTSSIGRQLGNILSQANGPVSITAHSQGGLTVSNALSSMALKGQNLASGSQIQLLGSASNPLVTRAIAGFSGVNVSSHTNFFDPISVVQLSPNPLQLIGGILGGPLTLAAHHSMSSYQGYYP